MALQSRSARVLLALAIALPGLVHGNCNWSKEDEDGFKQKVIIGTAVGSIIAVVAVAVLSLPVCCGILKEQTWLKFLGIGLGLAAGFTLAIPFITGSVAGTAIVDDMCNRCGGCSETDRSNASAAIGALGVLFAYTAAFGFVVVILGIIGMALSCCVCCPCCGPLAAYKAAQQQGGGTVVGKPVGA